MKVFLTVLTILATPFIVQAQSVTGTIIGENKQPLAGATIKLLRADDTTVVRGAVTNARGNFSIKNLTAGDYLPRVRSVGYRPLLGNKLTVGTGEVRFDATLEQESVQFDNVVVSASRTIEKASEAPASVSVVEAQQIRATNVVAPAEHLRGIAGVDIAQSGIAQQTVVTRGLSNVFSGLLMLMSDYRNAGVPSLRANISYLMPVIDADIARIEVVRGPGSALYGPNAANGVVNIVTKSPFAAQGTTVELTGGERGLFQASARHAGIIGENLGYKISGNYSRGRDWLYTDPVEQTNRQNEIDRITKDSTITDKARAIDSLLVGKRDFTFERYSIDGRLDYLLGENAQVTVQGGYAVAGNSIEMTDVSTAQARNWGYGYALGRLDYERLMVQSFVNFSNSGQTYLLRSGGPITDHSTQVVGRIQHSLPVGEMQEFTYGGDVFLTRPATDGTIMGRNEDNDAVNEFGAYLQSKTSLLDNMVDVVLAGRYDYHSRLEGGVFSPRAAVVFKPWEGQSFRATFNTGYTAPYPFDLFADIRYSDNVFGFPPEFAGFTTAADVKGIPENGYKFLREPNGNPLFRSPFALDKNSAMPIDATANFWVIATPFVIDGIMKDTVLTDEQKTLIAKFLRTTPAPTGDTVGGEYKMLNTTTEKFDPITSVADISGALKPTITTTIEIGYSGIFDDMFRASVDVYSSKITNFISTSRPFTPNVFLKSADVAAYLTAKGIPFLMKEGQLDSATAAFVAALLVPQLAAGYNSVPLGTAAVDGATDPTAIILAPRNFGEVNYWGADIALEFRPTASWTIGGTFSYVSQNLFKNVDNISDISLNAPKEKGSFSVSYSHDEIGLTAGVRYRHNGGFTMVSGIFSGVVNPYNLLDVTVGYDIPSVQGLRAVLSVSNILDFRHREFVGAPDIGRMGSLRASFTF